MTNTRRGLVMHQVRFGDVVKLNKTRVADPVAEGIERYVGIEHIEPEDLRIRSWGSVADGTTFTNYFEPGQVLFVKRRAYQRKVAVADFAGVCSGDIYVLESKDPNVLLPELLPFLCQTESFFEHAVGTSAGSLSPRTNWTQLANYEFALPPLAEQRRIAEVLTAMNVTSESLRSLRSSLAMVRDALIFERSTSLSKNGLHLFKDIVRTIDAGKSPKAGSLPAEKNEYGVLKVSAVGDWSFVANENKRIEQIDYLDEYQVRSGDFLVTRANADPNSVARTCIVGGSHPGLMLSDKTWRVQFRSDNPYLEVGVLAWTKSPIFRRYISQQLAGTEAKNISQKKFLSAPFPNCPPAEFNEFANEVSLVLRNLDVMDQRIDSEDMLRKSYSEAAFGT